LNDLAEGYVTFGPNLSFVDITIPITFDNRIDVEHDFDERLIISLDTDPTTGGQQGNPAGDLIRDQFGRLIERPGGTGRVPVYEVVPTKWEATLAIIDVDANLVSFSARDELGSELSGDVISGKISRSGLIDFPVTVTVDVSGTATRFVDYSLAATGGAVLAGTGRTVTVTIPANVRDVFLVASPSTTTFPRASSGSTSNSSGRSEPRTPSRSTPRSSASAARSSTPTSAASTWRASTSKQPKPAPPPPVSS
jgi:hypothetical protein